MDEELKRYLDDLRADLMNQINDGSERVLNRLGSLEKDFTNTKDFLISDALVSGRRWLDLEDRVSKLEQKRQE